MRILVDDYARSRRHTDAVSPVLRAAPVSSAVSPGTSRRIVAAVLAVLALAGWVRVAPASGGEAPPDAASVLRQSSHPPGPCDQAHAGAMYFDTSFSMPDGARAWPTAFPCVCAAVRDRQIFEGVNEYHDLARLPEPDWRWTTMGAPVTVQRIDLGGLGSPRTLQQATINLHVPASCE